MADSDPNEDASSEVKKVTGEASFVSGAELLGSPKLQDEFEKAKIQAKLDDLKEDIFRAWKDWDCEVEDVQAKDAAKKKVHAAIDKYKDAIGSKGARWSFFLRLGPEYSDWRKENDD